MEMPRVRAENYDAKVRGIMDAAAGLFSRTGYPGAKMQDIATACGASKSMLYHYFPTKDDLLFAMLKEHLEGLISAIEAVGTASGDSQAQFVAFVRAFIHKSAQARQRNLVAMNDVKYLPKVMQAPLVILENRVVDLVVDQLGNVNPNLQEQLYRPYALLLLGKLNSVDIWYKPNGSIKAAELVERISRLFLLGFLKET